TVPSLQEFSRVPWPALSLQLVCRSPTVARLLAMDSRRSAPTYPTKEKLISEWWSLREALRAYIEQWSTMASDDTLEVTRQALPDSSERPLTSLPLKTWLEHPDLDTTAAAT
ncbi:unnamed protein product, partial [Phaeothamnion confervicola]